MSSEKKKIRANFRDAVFARDNYSCKVCGHEGILDAHHITDRNELPNGGYVEENGISLCDVCHIKAEIYHSSNGVEWVEGFHPEDLYALISSSLEEAIKASRKLCSK